ncbi:MAG: protein-glutamate O-methyltransferase CheR [Fusobacteria bacterium]|nr:protein-glutamate O-methyltransferase CheR [Fusobacteriota bacterium]
MSEKMGDIIQKNIESIMSKSQNIIDGRTGNLVPDEYYKMFKELVYHKFGMDINDSKRHGFEMKISKLVEKSGLSYKQYHDKLDREEDRELTIEFLNEITINKTDFFREINHFNYIKDEINLILQYNPRILTNKEIKVWSSACSTGEEPYSLAITLREALPQDIKIKILATDISHKVLKKAITGVYPIALKDQINEFHLRKYFHIEKDAIIVKDELRDMISFRSFNLKSNFPFKNKFDIIFCRNVMIYFDSIFQEKLINDFYNFTVKGGLLFVGHSESLSYLKHNYKYLKPTIYLK